MHTLILAVNQYVDFISIQVGCSSRNSQGGSELYKPSNTYKLLIKAFYFIIHYMTVKIYIYNLYVPTYVMYISIL